VFRIKGLELRIKRLRFDSNSLGFRIKGLGSRV